MECCQMKKKNQLEQVMTLLTLRFKEKNLKDYALMRGQHLTIGRNPDNDIIIDNPAVSGYHARIESVASSFVIRDLDSTNGVFVNERRIETHALQHNDRVSIGKHELLFNKMVFDRDARVDQQDKDKIFFTDETRLLDTNEYKELIEKAKKEGAQGDIPEADPREETKKGLFSRLKSKLRS